MSLVMLDTVPAGVRELATSQEWLEKLTSGHPELGIRLVSTSYPDMRDAWARVCEHGDPEFPTFFFHFALELPATWERLPKAVESNIKQTSLESLQRPKSSPDYWNGTGRRLILRADRT